MSEARSPTDNPKDEEVITGQAQNEGERCVLLLENIFLLHGFQVDSNMQRRAEEKWSLRNWSYIKNPGQADFSQIMVHGGPNRNLAKETFLKEGAIYVTAHGISPEEIIKMIESTGQFRARFDKEFEGTYWVYPIGD